MIAVIAGATGLTGSHLLKLLLQDERITKVISVGRRSTEVQHPKLQEVMLADFSALKNHTKELAGDLYFCCLGTTIKTAGTRENFAKVDYMAVIDFARVAKQNQAKAFAIVSASSASAKSLIFYSQVKGEAEDVLKKLGLSHLIIFQPAMLIGDRIYKRRGEEFASKIISATQVFMTERFKKRLATPVDRLAKRMLSEALGPKPSAVLTIPAVEI